VNDRCLLQYKPYETRTKRFREKMMKTKLFLLTLGCVFWVQGCSNTPAQPVTIGFWNVENLFDLVDDPEKNDDEFTPEGRKHVTEETLTLKLNHIAEVLGDLNADIMGLCEVENEDMLRRLNTTYTGRDYRWVHYESPDDRGIDVALFYDPTVFEVVASEPISISFDSGRPTRDILHVEGKLWGQILHIFVNHWPSNYGGREQAIPRRARVAAVLRERVQTILNRDPQAEILLMGDFNEGPTETAVHDILGSTLDEFESDTQLRNLMAPFVDRPDVGTYVWRGQDEILDQILVSQGLLDDRGLTIVDSSIRINDQPKYRQQDGKYQHYPFRFWAGDRLLGGYSDHLAVSVKVEKR